MDKNLSLKKMYDAYKRWVISNPNLVTDVETVSTWSSYFIAGKINKSPVVSELVYSISKLVSLYNDRLIREAYGSEANYYGLREQIKVWLTVIHYSEVFVELIIKSRWGMKGKWTAATILQLLKCTSALVLLHRFKEVPISHPPIPALHRRKFTDGKEIEEVDSFFTLKRSGRIVRRVDGAPPVAFRDWQPVRVKDEQYSKLNAKDILYAESLHILKPIIHLAAMRVFGTKAWKQWLVSLSVDVACMRLYSKHMKDMSQEQRLELSRRKLSLVLYFLRSPMYNGYSKNVIESTLTSLSNKIPMLSILSGPIIQYLNHWQDIYFYMWAS
ncbi:Peroxin 16 [Operophtera brumata]|uniref:Peroxisomal membrane protein PEX16 n=1 Tax=Operophtera brumata TaxID=104452 RepID=A0A0L7KMI7_OPEBR|nr:Peroxin 16 [Operophtera brumata]